MSETNKRRHISTQNKIEKKIFKNYTPEEVQEYLNLQELYNETMGDYYAITHFLLFPSNDTNPGGIYPADFDSQINFTREQAEESCQRLRASLESIQEAYFENAIYKAVQAEYLRLYGDREPNRYPDIFIYAIIPDEEHETPERRKKYNEYNNSGRISELSKEVYNLESYLLLELIQNPEKYREVHREHEQTLKELEGAFFDDDPDAPTLDDEFKRQNLLDTLIMTEWLDQEGNERPDGLFFVALEAARKAKEEAEKKAKNITTLSIKEKGVKTVEYPLDKINNNIWNSLLTADKDGQLTMFFDTMRQGATPQPLVIYSIDFDTLEDASIIKKLTPYDKRIYIAVNALYSAGYDVITINQIYYVITNRKTKPNSKDREKINKSLSKMAARLHLDNAKEKNETFAKYPRFKYDGALLPFDRIEIEANGNTAEAIRIYRPADEGAAIDRALPLVKFAKQRGQYTTISSRVFGALSLTDSNLEIEDYLIEQIGHIKRGLINNKMLYETLLAATHQTTKMQRIRAKEKITALLDHFKNIGFIKDYETATDGITITYEQQKAIKQQNK